MADMNSYVPARKFTYNLLRLEVAKKSQNLFDCESLDLQKTKLFVKQLA